jgi:hypothetical protein
VTSSWGGTRYAPMAFTEQGVAMLSSVLRSRRAIQVNIQILRAFTRLRQMLSGDTELRNKIEKMEEKYDQNFQVVFEAIKQLLEVEARPKRKSVLREKSRLSPKKAKAPIGKCDRGLDTAVLNLKNDRNRKSRTLVKRAEIVPFIRG